MKTWEEIAQIGSASELRLALERYEEMLDVFKVGSFFFMVLNDSKTEIAYCGAGVQKVLGYSPQEMNLEQFCERIHPDDFRDYQNAERLIDQLYKTLPTAKRMKYKTRFGFRMKHKDGRTLRILQQGVAIHYTDQIKSHGKLLVLTDVTHLNGSVNTGLSMIGLNGEASQNLLENEHTKSQEIFTRREKQILALLSANKSSGEIAELLCISKHTVSNHRKNMLRKTKSDSTLKLVMQGCNWESINPHTVRGSLNIRTDLKDMATIKKTVF